METACKICGFRPSCAYLMGACICYMADAELIALYRLEGGKGPLADHLRKLMDARCLIY